MGKGFALVHWIESKRTEILKCQMIPDKYRRENAVVNLKCRHRLSGLSEARLAKIVKIEQNKADLHSITVDPDTGTIVQMSANKLSKVTINNSEILTKEPIKRKDLKKKKKNKKKKTKTGKHKKSKHIDNNTDSDESSSSESSTEESANEPEDDSDEDDSRAMKSLLSSVTADSIKFIRKLLPLMEKTYKRQQNKTLRKRDPIIEDPFAIIDAEPPNLQSFLEGFLPPMTIAAIFHRCGDPSDWKKITTDILVEIYGKQLAHLSAKGSRGAQGIDPAVYRTIYDLINMRMGWILPTKEFVRHVNKVCSNRKKAQKLKITNNPPDAWSDIQVKRELPTTSTHMEPQQPTNSASSSVANYEHCSCMPEPMENDTKPIIISVRSIADSRNSIVPSSSRVDAPSTHVNPYLECISDPSSSQMETHQVSSHYLGEYI